MNTDDNQPLYAVIAQDLREAIASGSIKAGTRLPAVTSLARERGVTAATIRRALRDLTEEGLITSHVGRGTFVAPSGKGMRKRAFTRDRAEALRDLMALANRPGIIAFTRGIGDPETVERGTLTRLAHEALEGGEDMFLDYGDPRGLPPLREAIAALYREQGIEVSPSQVLVTSGSQQALALIAREAAETGTPVACEAPCYTGVTNAFEAFGVESAFVPRDAEGPRMDALRDALPGTSGPGILYLCPILHNPMGTDLSPERRKAVTAWALETGSTVLSDEIYRDLHLGPGTPPSFLGDLGFEQTLVLGSLSKSFISGLRVGWIIASEGRIRGLTAVKKAMDLGCPPLMQGIARVFIEDREGYRAHREKVKEHYRLRRDAVLAALSKRMPGGVRWTAPAGGFQLWLSLPEGSSASELLPLAVAEGVSFLPGELQSAGDRRYEGDIRLCYGSIGLEEIDSGIERLARAMEAYLQRGGPGAAGTSGSARQAAGMGDF